MKKVFLSIVLIVFLVIGTSSVVNAVTSKNLADEVYKVGKKYGVTLANKARIERYLSENYVSDEKAEKVLAKAKEVAKIYEKAGVTKFSDLSYENKEKVRAIAIETGKIVDITVKYKGYEIEMYQNGKLIEVARYDGNRLVYTGNTVNYSLIIISSVAGIALIAGLVLRKKFVNA